MVAQKATHIRTLWRLKKYLRCGPDQSRKSAKETSCTPLVNLARKPRPITTPRAIHCQVRPEWIAVQNRLMPQAQDRMLIGSMVMMIASAAKRGIIVTRTKHHSAVRSSKSRRAKEKSSQLV